MLFVNLVLAMFVALSCHGVFADEIDDETGVYACAAHRDRRLLRADRAATSAYLPEVEMSYRFHPRQSQPSVVGWWSSNIWPVDSFWENDGVNPSSKTTLDGERHSFWFTMRWDFDSAIFGQKQKYARLMQDARSREHMRSRERLMRIRDELVAADTERDPESLHDKIGRVATRATLAATYAYLCDDGLNHPDD